MSVPPAPESSVSRVAVKAPPFWKGNPQLWFVNLEAQFSLSGITADETKFYYVVSFVDSEILGSVSDIVTVPPEKDKYKTLKTRLISIYSDSTETRIKKLLHGLDLGDQRPSQLLTRMRALSGGTFGEDLLKSLWLSRLPVGTQTVLAALREDLNGLAEVADKINEQSTNSDPCRVNAVVSRTEQIPDTRLSELEFRISQLTTVVEEVRSSLRHPRAITKSREPFHAQVPERSLSRPRRYREPANGMCFFHTNFGILAKKCKHPCSFNQTSGN